MTWSTNSIVVGATWRVVEGVNQKGDLGIKGKMTALGGGDNYLQCAWRVNLNKRQISESESSVENRRWGND